MRQERDSIEPEMEQVLSLFLLLWRQKGCEDMAYYPTAFSGYQPQQMPMNSYSPMPQNAPTGQQGFSVRPVASREEAMAIQTDFFGPGILMPCLGQGTIWLKRFNQNTGASDLLEFIYAPPQAPKQESPGDYVPMDLFRQLVDKVNQIEKGVMGSVPDAE